MGWLCEVLNSPEYRTRKSQALQVASYNLLDDAEDCLNQIDDEATNAKVRRQTELYQHKLYLAKTKNKAELDLNYKEPANLELATIIPQLVLKTIEPLKPVKSLAKNVKKS